MLSGSEPDCIWPLELCPKLGASEQAGHMTTDKRVGLSKKGHVTTEPISLEKSIVNWGCYLICMLAFVWRLFL